MLGLCVSLILCYRYPFCTDAFIFPVILLFAILSIICVTVGVTFSLIKPYLKLSLTYTIGILLYILISIIIMSRGIDGNHLLLFLTSWLILLIYTFALDKNLPTLFRLCLNTGICTGIIIAVNYFVLQRINFLSNIFGFETITEQAFLTCIAQLATLQTITKTHSILAKFSLLILCTLLFTAIINLESRTGIIAQLGSILIFLIRNTKNHLRIIYIATSLLITMSACGLKLDSTSGRIFIYKTSLKMLDTPYNILIGRGFQGFRNEYMPIQAQQLKTENHTTRQRADEINHPLNEFLNIAINYGIPALLCFVAATWLILNRITLTPIQRSFVFTLVIFSLLTYPFRYPITWYSLAIFIASLSRMSIQPQKSFSIQIKYAIPGMIILIILITSIGWEQWNNHRQWEDALNSHRLGKWELANNLYDELNSRFSTSEFAFNNAAHYMENGSPLKALTALESCKVKNYSTIMLEGKIKAMIGDQKQALDLFALAHNMCPNRFQPLLELYKLNLKSGNFLKASVIAYEILHKPIKIQSNEITKIIHYVQESENNRANVANPITIGGCDE